MNEMQRMQLTNFCGQLEAVSTADTCHCNTQAALGCTLAGCTLAGVGPLAGRQAGRQAGMILNGTG